jgi:putative serine protease PepD
MRRLPPLAALASLLVLGACSNPPTAPAATPGGTPRATSRATTAPAAAPAAPDGPFDPTQAAANLGPSVGLVITQTGQNVSEGSAFVIASQGGDSYLATNNHVVAGGRQVQVMMPDGRHYVAEVVGTDAFEDLAVLKVQDGLPVATFADSTRLRTGTPVLAIGSPLGAQNAGTVTTGVVSALHRTLSNVSAGAQGSENLPDVLQTDAAINPGNSGGPLADANGHVVGMNTAGASGANGIGYAIPSAVVQKVTRQLMAGKTPGHPFVGITFNPVAEALATEQVQGWGIVVQCVVGGGPADKAGMQKGDVIEKVDNVELNNGQTLGGALQLKDPGETVTMSGLRGGSAKSFQVTLANRTSTTQTACRG